MNTARPFPTRSTRPRSPLFRLTTALLALAALLTACSDPSSVERPPNAPGAWPSVLHMSYSPSEEDVEGRMEMLEELTDYLGEQVGIPIHLVQAQGYGPTIEAMRAKKIDIARTGSFAYMIAHEKAGAEAIVARGKKAKGPGLYSSIIVASPSQGMRSLEDLKARAADTVFAFVDPASTSGHLTPRAGLEANGFDPKEDFERLVFTMSHTNSAMALVSGKLDAGAMSRTTYDRMVAAGSIQADDLVILWESEPIPTGPIIVRRELPEEIKSRLQAAYLNLNEEGGAILEALRTQANTPDLIYFPAEDAMWDGLREIAYNLETMQLLTRN